MEYELYYVSDQSGDINGDKISVAYFETEQECHDKASLDGIEHYSIELENSLCFTILFIK